MLCLKAHALAVGAADLSQFLAPAVEHDRRLLVRITFELLRSIARRSKVVHRRDNLGGAPRRAAPQPTRDLLSTILQRRQALMPSHHRPTPASILLPRIGSRRRSPPHPRAHANPTNPAWPYRHPPEVESCPETSPLPALKIQIHLSYWSDEFWRTLVSPGPRIDFSDPSQSGRKCKRRR